MKKVAVVGLGYVGLPLAVAFGKKLPTIGFDLDKKKLTAYLSGKDPSGEVEPEDLAAATFLELTNDPARLAEADVIIVAVPTPIDQAHKPDLRAVHGASRTIAEHLSPGTTVVYESTVYPGCTEETCVPILESVSGMPWLGKPGATSEGNQNGFHIGYSPERINPGDKVHRLETIVKVVSGDTPETLEKVANTYEQIITALSLIHI